MTGILRSALSSALSLLLLSVLAAEVAAQGAEPPPDPEPLRPVDTSSPRATLRSFLRNADRVAELRRGGEIGGERGNEAARRAVATLDLSATPHGNSRTIRGERAALLHEVLGRLDLPPESEIPGVREVADGQITRWTIPGTTIAFERVAAGRGGCDREPVDKHHKRVCATSECRKC